MHPVSAAWVPAQKQWPRLQLLAAHRQGLVKLTRKGTGDLAAGTGGMGGCCRCTGLSWFQEPQPDC
jgi:hypothetical protein